MPLPTFSLRAGFCAQPSGDYLVIGSGRIGSRIWGPFAIGSTVEVTERLMGFSAFRGREDELGGVQEGQVTADLVDDDGSLDPDNAASPYYPHVRHNRGLQVIATYSGTDYSLGYAFTDDHPAEPQAMGANVSLHGVDLFKRIGMTKLTATYPSQLSGARVNAILDSLGWSPTFRAIDPGQQTLPGVTLTNANPLDHLSVIRQAEIGIFFIDGRGYAVFHDRHHRYAPVELGTFGAGGLPVASVTPRYHDRGVYNWVRVKRTAGTEQIYLDATSRDLQQGYGPRDYDVATEIADQFQTDAEAFFWARHVVNIRKDPLGRIAEVEIDPAGDDSLWPIALGSEIGDRIVLDHSIPGTKGVEDQSYYIESVAHRWNATENDYRCTWRLSYAGDHRPFVIGKARIGDAALAY